MYFVVVDGATAPVFFLGKVVSPTFLSRWICFGRPGLDRPPTSLCCSRPPTSLVLCQPTSDQFCAVVQTDLRLALRCRVLRPPTSDHSATPTSPRRFWLFCSLVLVLSGNQTAVHSSVKNFRFSPVFFLFSPGPDYISVLCPKQL